MVDKAKMNIKCLDTNINVAYDSSTSRPSVPFFVSASTAKYAAIAAV